MRTQQSRDDGSLPSLSGVLQRFQRFEFAIQVKTVTRFRFHRRGALSSHFVQAQQNAIGKLLHGRFAHTVNAGANTASSFGNFFVICAVDTLLKIDQTRVGKDRMCMGVDKAWKNNLAPAVDLFRGS